MQKMTFTKKAVAAAVAIFAMTGPAVANSAPTAQSNTEARANSRADSPETGADRKICVRTTLTGSRLPIKVCRTEREWNSEGGVPAN